jgi:uncharacterized membrane protein
MSVYTLDPEECTCAKTSLLAKHEEEKRVYKQNIPYRHISSAEFNTSSSNVNLGVGIALIVIGVLFILFGFFVFFFLIVFSVVFIVVGIIAIISGATTQSAVKLILDNGHVYNMPLPGKGTQAEKSRKVVEELFDTIESKLANV